MNDFNLPTIKGFVSAPDQSLSMDEYLEFVQFNWDNVVDQQACWEWKKIIAIDVPFRLT